ncbi:Pkinase-domain-containing protein [Epithele typhae]|uniref:Pkinase-domain-containing protein n=1 Tax=Epithele typhae TaxID=378194 RepID=UPI0020083CF2|nr:Pkinase-domain-containing protein [Epithele typhae]KAH9944479.1 Pkinase-domain-containing protein [Epithele typhae]
MSDVAGPSTPSRKPAAGEPAPKRRPKSKATTPDKARTPDRVSTPTPSQVAAPKQTRATHSLFVPPRTAHPPLLPSRSVYCYERLNSIEEGSYGVVFRARDKQTGDIVALKKLKLEEEKHGFPITALREVNALMVCKHENVVGIREVVVGDTLTQVFIVMDFIEHDLKTLLTVMPAPFLQSEVKTLTLQLLSAVAHCHERWILHRDLKTSNLLMNNRGTIKTIRRPVGVGGLTQLVVTLWYRAPEILLGATTYSTAVDMWSVGCIFAELLQRRDRDDFHDLQASWAPNEPDLAGLPDDALAQTITLPTPHLPQLRQKFPYITAAGIDLLSRLLAYDPEERISAEEALKHPYFSESPLPKHPDLFGSFPLPQPGEPDSPSAPARAADYKLLTEFD